MEAVNIKKNYEGEVPFEKSVAEVSLWQFL